MKKALGLKSPGPPPSPRVFGCVIGVQRGRTVEIFNSFELLYDPDTHSLERGFLEKKQELYKKVFPNFYILGWHSTGSDAQESDMTIHKADSHMLKPALKYLTVRSIGAPAVLLTLAMQGFFRGFKDTKTPLYVIEWHAVAAWTWDTQDETCGICRMAFDGCCPDCKLPGDDCSLIWGACNHAFHLQLLM